MLAGALGMSVYKIAVANAYVTLKLPTAADSLEQPSYGDVQRGAQVAALAGCADCHGPDYSGRTLLERPGYATIHAPNLTAGTGGRGRSLNDAALARSIQSGLDSEHRILWTMPRSGLTALAQSDVWALVAFLRSMPAVNREHPQNRLDFWGYIDVATRRLRIVDRTPIPLVPPKIARPAVGLDNAVAGFGAESVEHALWRKMAPGPSEADFGPYVRAIAQCGTCHGQTRPLLGRVPAPALRADTQDFSRCQVAGRLAQLTSTERAALLCR